MFEKLLENIKFVILLALYVFYMTWWASGITTSVQYIQEGQAKNTATIEKTLSAIHTQVNSLASLVTSSGECKERVNRLEARIDSMEIKLDNNTRDIARMPLVIQQQQPQQHHGN